MEAVSKSLPELKAVVPWVQLRQPLTLKLVLKGTIPSKKNNKTLGVNKSGKAYQTTSAAYKQWYKEFYPIVVDWLYSQAQRFPDLELPITQKIKFKVLFYFGDNRDRDLSNKIETLQDLLKDAGVIYDDSYRILSLESDGKYTKGSTRTEIYLTMRSMQNDPELVKWFQDKKDRTYQRKMKKIRVYTTDELL